MVAATQGTRQTDHSGEVLRELLAMHVLHLQLRLRDDRDVGQGLAVEHQRMLVQLPTPGELLKLAPYCDSLINNFPFSQYTTTFGGIT